MQNLNLSLYKLSDLENRISAIYRDNGIMNVSDLKLNDIASIFNTRVVYAKGKTKVLFDEGFAMLFIRDDDPEPVQRLDFFHELAHVAMHVGNQNRLPAAFVDLQEAQASLFQLYASMPFYMVEELLHDQDPTMVIKSLSESFKLPHSAVQRRIDQIDRRIQSERRRRNMSARTTEQPAVYGYSDATLKILDQLYRQINRKRGSIHAEG
ncbi:ImmA/IrrE family metallo-endopeptidase [Paenibacillus sp. 2TAB19]|uniref:ImmA/IrrE family metallo-endopeptidase n=1 Tax=Paenibacillus sp. 2TAB19 TaxID=3233003 RepID=UPI003F9C2D91